MKLNERVIFSDFSQIPQEFSGVLLDAYGVFWGGNDVGVLPGSREMMAQLVASGKVVGILSNTTQMAEKEMRKLYSRGLEQGIHYHFFLTSGEVARSVFLQGNLPFPTPRKRFFVAGGYDHAISSHHAIFEGTDFQETFTIEEADFIYLKVPRIAGEDKEDPGLFLSEMKDLRSFNLPLVCSNPDLFAHEGNPARLVVRQGSLAHLYEQLGGEVFYIGKPHEASYTMAMRAFIDRGIFIPSQVIMVGDTPETDIRGARKFGMSTALITQTGIMAHRDDLHSLPACDQPDFILKRLGPYAF